MELAEIKEKKQVAEEIIRKTLMAFAESTGLAVRGVDFDMMDVTEIGGKNDVRCTAVQLRVEIE